MNIISYNSILYCSQIVAFSPLTRIDVYYILKVICKRIMKSLKEKYMDPDASRSTTGLIVLFIFIILRAYFIVCEHAVMEINDSKVKLFAEKDKRYKALLKLIETPNKMMTAFSIQRAFSSVLISICSVIAFNPSLTKLLNGILNDVGIEVLEIVSIVIISLLTAMVIVVFTDTVPRQLAISIKDNFAVKCVGSVRLLIYTLALFSAITSAFSTLIFKIIRVPVSSEKDVVTEEEILMMVEAGNETGIIEANQRTMINNIFGFGDVTVSEVMTHRTDLVAVDVEAKITQIVTLVINEGFSRIPVYEKNIDNIIGVLYIKDLLCLIGYEKIEGIDIAQFIRKVMYIPETSKCNDVFEKMTLKKAQIAIVVDEYGGTAGIVTMEDLLEEIVGNIQDEYDDEEAEFFEISEGVYVIDGSADPEDILPQLKVVLPDDHSYDTMSALFVDVLGRIPNKDETSSIEYKGLELTALVMEDNWVTKIKARVLEENQIEQGTE